MPHPLRALCSVVVGLTIVGSLAAAAAPEERARGGRPPKVLPRPEPGPRTVGTSVAYKLEPRLQHAFEARGRFVWADLIQLTGASFLKAHFVDVNLREGDVLRLRSASGEVVEEIRGRGPKNQGTFWALSAFGEELQLELDFAAPYAKAPFWIDQVIPGDASILGSAQSPESICAPENYDDVFCYRSDPGKWSNVMASVGVLTIGGNPTSALWCSGSNISPENYLLTNQHCIETQGKCDTSEFVFKYYRTGCNNGAPTTGDWQGFHCDHVVATSPNGGLCDPNLSNLDYTLCSVIGDPAATFGYVTPDPVRLTDGEAVYMIQHAFGRPHEITHGSGSDVDVSGTVLRYYDTMDTEGGSSGSPIFRESNDRMVGLHHCGGCEDPGVGNRGMLMADIYPQIEDLLCSAAVDLTAVAAVGLQKVKGDADLVLEPGETWQFRPRVRNRACSAGALAVIGEVRVNAASLGHVTLIGNMASFGNVAAGATADALAPIQFKVSTSAPCGTIVAFDLVNVDASNSGPFAGMNGVVSRQVGEDPLTTLFTDGFSAPSGWSIVNGGTGSGTASTWTTQNPFGRSLPLTEPFNIADSDALGQNLAMNEELIGPVVNCTGFSSVQLQFKHDFKWYSGGLDEQCDVDIRSSATGNAWVNVAKFQDGNASGTVTIDVSAQTVGQSNVQVRFHYYNAVWEWWWAVDDVFLLGSNGFDCDVFQDGWSPGPITPTGPGNTVPPGGRIKL